MVLEVAGVIGPADVCVCVCDEERSSWSTKASTCAPITPIFRLVPTVKIGGDYVEK